MCMCMFMCVYVYVYIYVYVHVCLCLCMCVCLCMCMCMCMCVYVYVYVYVCVCLCLCVCACVFMFMFIYIYTCLCICVCLCMFISTEHNFIFSLLILKLLNFLYCLHSHSSLFVTQLLHHSRDCFSIVPAFLHLSLILGMSSFSLFYLIVSCLFYFVFFCLLKIHDFEYIYIFCCVCLVFGVWLLRKCAKIKGNSFFFSLI